MDTADNIVFYGTQAYDGSGTGMVIGTGDRTMLVNMLRRSGTGSGARARVKSFAGPKPKKALVQALRKKGLVMKEPAMGMYVLLLFSDMSGVVAESKLSVGIRILCIFASELILYLAHVLCEGKMFSAVEAAMLSEGKTWSALLRACVLGCNASFVVSQPAPKGVKIPSGAYHCDVVCFF